MDMIIPEEEIITVMALFRIKGPVFPFPGDVRLDIGA